MSETMKFRKAVPGDEGLILTFIRELADYEGMLDQVVADEATLHTWIFEKEKAEALFVLEGETEVGFALFFQRFERWSNGDFSRNCNVSSSEFQGTADNFR